MLANVTAPVPPVPIATAVAAAVAAPTNETNNNYTPAQQQQNPPHQPPPPPQQLPQQQPQQQLPQQQQQQPPQEPQYPPPLPTTGVRTIPRIRLHRPNDVDRYRSTLLRFMRYKDKIAYPNDYVFSVEELTTITPEHIYAWMCYRVYGKEDPDPTDRPLFAMENGVKGWKKQLSYYMIDNLNAWREVTRDGNPTRSTLINDLIKAVGLKETRGLGLPSNADRPFEPHEFVQFLFHIKVQTLHWIEMRRANWGFILQRNQQQHGQGCLE